MASAWLQTCLRGHQSCQVEADLHHQLPTRVIDVGAGESGIHPHPRLVNGSDHVGPYVALSYCWGPERLLTFTASNEDQLRSGIPLSEFPPTLRDAVEVTRSLGYQFLWIDALCIQQDSKADWDNEAAKMRRVYRGAVVTLSAAAASKASDGMLYYRSMPLTICRLPWLSSVNSQQSAFFGLPLKLWTRNSA